MNKWRRITLSTPLGYMIALADEEKLYLLAFADQPKIEDRIAALATKLNVEIRLGTNVVLDQLREELRSYFEGHLKIFTVPCVFMGTSFQQQVWHVLSRVPYGTTVNYEQQAQALEKPTAFRAVANANGANMIAILVPCHRVIKKSGDICGYNGGVWRKQWLLNHERMHL